MGNYKIFIFHRKTKKGGCLHVHMYNTQIQWRTQGGSTSPPAKTEKIVVENDVISEGSIFSNKFSQKIDKNLNFLLNFHQKSSKFSQNFPNQLFFVQPRENLTLGF